MLDCHGAISNSHGAVPYLHGTVLNLHGTVPHLHGAVSVSKCYGTVPGYHSTVHSTVLGYRAQVVLHRVNHTVCAKVNLAPCQNATVQHV